MRRSASPSKATGSTPARSFRRDDSSAVLRTPFKPLSGLESKRTTSQPAPAATGTAARVSSTPSQQLQRRVPEASSSSASPTRLRARSIAELQAEVDDMELILTERLATHNAARRAQNLPEQQPEQIVAEYISLLTQYNKVKDAAQLIFDKIADIEQLPARDIHARYGVGESEHSA